MIPILRRRGYLPTLFNEEFLGNELLSTIFGDDEQHYTMPSVNIDENNDSFTIEVAAPGFSKKDFAIDLNGSTLEITGEKKIGKDDSTSRSLRKEFHYAKFQRTFTLPTSVNTDRIKAAYNDGILNIQIPKREEAKVKPAKQISIS